MDTQKVRIREDKIFHLSMVLHGGNSVELTTEADSRRFIEPLDSIQ